MISIIDRYIYKVHTFKIKIHIFLIDVIFINCKFINTKIELNLLLHNTKMYHKIALN